MDRRISKNKRENKKNNGNKRKADKTACNGKTGRRQKLEAPEGTTADIIKLTLDHFFPDLNLYLQKLPDPRLQERITYSKEQLFYLGLTMFLFHYGSRNQLEN